LISIKNKSEFAERFITKFLDNGFGSLTKREIDVYVMYLLLEDGQFYRSDGELDFHEISLELKISESKVRNLIYEVELKYKNDQDFVEQLISIIEKGKYEVIGDNKIKFSVHSPMLKQYFEYEIRNLDGVSDGSFAKHIVTISRTTFEKLLLKLYANSDGDNAEEIINSLPEELKEKITDKESLIKEFVREFGKGFSSASGERSAHMLFDVIDPAGFLKRLFG